MSAKKKVLAAASYVMVAALAIGGTMAYFTDQTDPVTNVRTVGDVKIAQHEYQRAEGVTYNNDGVPAEEGDLVPFEQGQMIMPAVPATGASSDYSAALADEEQFWWGYYTNGNGSNGLWNDSKLSNVMDKFVFVENTGDSDVFYRTVIAFECPDGVEYGEAASGADFMINTNSNYRFTWDGWDFVEIDGTRYAVTTAVYNVPLTPSEISRPSLLQVVMTHNADNEVAEALGDTYEVLVLSQAIQADANIAAIEDKEERGAAVNEMLDAAFGDVATNAASWFDGSVTVAAPQSGAVRPAGYIPSTEGETINNLVIVDESDDVTNLRAIYNGEGGSANYTTKDIIINNSYLDGTYAMNLYAVDGSGAKLVVSDTALLGWVSYTGFASAEFTNCTFDINSEGQYKTIRPYDTSVFTNCDFAADYEFLFDMLGAEDTVTFENCTIGGVAITASTFDASAPVVIK